MARLKRSPALVAAAQRIDLSSPSEAAKLRKRRQDWQKDAWDYFDQIGEVKYATSSFVGGALQKIKLFPAIKEEDTDNPISANEPRAEEALGRLENESGGHGVMLKELGVNLMIAGECYLVGTDTNDQTEESWEVRSVDEVESGSDGKTYVKESPSGDKRELNESDFLLRIWLKHPRWSGLADSPLHGVIQICEELLIVDRAIRAIARSRISTGGVYWIPSEMDFSKAAKEDDPPGASTFGLRLTENLITPIQNEGDATSVSPFVVEAAGDLIDKVKWEKFDRPFDAQLLERGERALRRLAQGLNVPPEVVLGLADVNHWTAWQIDENAFKTGVEPLVMEIVWALTSGFLRPMLEEMKVPNAGDIMVWYDSSGVSLRPENQRLWQEVGLPALITGGIMTQNEARKELGLPDIEGADELMEPTSETERRAESREGPPRAVRAAANGLGSQLTEIDSRLRERLWEASDMALRRMFEKAGARVVSKSRKDKAISEVIRDVPVGNIPAILGPATIKALGIDIDQLVRGAFDEVERKWNQYTREAAEQTMDLVPDLAERVSVAAQLDQYRAEGWTFLESALSEVAKRKLFDPTPDKPEQGELSDGNLVPFDVIREAVALAGGGNQQVRTAQLLKAVKGAWVALGIATGSFMRKVFSDHDVKTEGYRWEYGLFPRTRPFEPHRGLDGVFFENFDDPVLLNHSGFPETSHYMPGDHNGCVCDVVPAMEG